MAMVQFTVPLDRAFYERIRRNHGQRSLIKEGVVTARSGDAIEVRHGQILRIVLTEGPQICDFNAWNLDDPTEAFWSGRTRIFENTHLTVFNRLWSTPPRMRPIATIVEDTVEHRPPPGGSPGHDCLGARCTERMWSLVAGLPGHSNCQTNLATAIAPYGLGPQAVHDAFNIFMKTWVSPEDGTYRLSASDARRGDYIELYAEVNLLVALSACPAGAGGTGLAANIEAHPLGYQVFGASVELAA
jgi:uncharacterized protein